MQDHGVAVPDAYTEFARSIFERMVGAPAGLVTRSLDVAEAIWGAVNDPARALRQPAGADALALAAAS
jgi:hypothetical protein